MIADLPGANQHQGKAPRILCTVLHSTYSCALQDIVRSADTRVGSSTV